MLYNSVEGLGRETQKRMAGTDFSFQYYLKYGPQKIFNLEVTDTSGMEHTVKIPSIKLSEWEQRYSGDIYYYDDVSVAYDLNFNDANGYAIMRISTFEFNQEKQQQAFEHFCNNSFELLRAKPNITNLIIDLRQNPGGDLYNAFYLFSFLAREPFLQYTTVYSKVSKLPFSNLLDEEFSGDKETEINQSIAEKFTQRVKSGYWKYADSFNREWVPDANAYKGKIFLVTNAKVNSAASYFALMVKNSGIGEIVGKKPPVVLIRATVLLRSNTNYPIPASVYFFRMPILFIITNPKKTMHAGWNLIILFPITGSHLKKIPTGNYILSLIV
jgi:hypothetical protein